MFWDIFQTCGKPVANCVVLTGLPRSGTTLTCHLLNQLPNTVALHEPMKVSVFKGQKSRNYKLNELDRFFRSSRESLLNQGTALTKHVGGRVPDNTAAQQQSDSGLRRHIATRGQISFDKNLDENFQLIIKHPSAFSAMLDVLSGSYPCYAVVRNPLSVLGSWNSVEHSAHLGHIPAAENIDRDLSRRLNQMDDVFDRQFYILHWFFDRFTRYLRRESILRYEDIIGSGGRVLKAINPAAENLQQELTSRNQNKLYDEALMTRLGERLVATQGAFWDIYQVSEVEEILNSTH